jgi:hypothetical protein
MAGAFQWLLLDIRVGPRIGCNKGKATGKATGTGLSAAKRRFFAIRRSPMAAS